MDALKPSKRHGEILELVRRQGTCEIAELARYFGVSLETIRRDVKPLTHTGRLIRMHGAVSLPDRLGEAPFERRMRENAQAKQTIAAAFARRVVDGDSLILDTGTTTSYLARALLGRNELTVITNSSDIARTMATVNDNRVYMAGGELRGDNGAAFGSSAIEFVSRFRVRYTVLSIGGIDARGGFMDFELAEREFAHMALRCGDVGVVISDQSKFGRTGLVNVAGFDEIDLLVTDALPPSKIAKALEAGDVEVEIAEVRREKTDL